MTLAPRAWLVVALFLGATTAASAQPMSGNGVIVNPAPMYLTPDPSRIPLVTLPAGTAVRVLAREGDWLRIIFRDRYLGDRTGYVLAAAVRVEPVAPPAAPASPPPPVPGQLAPAPTAAAQPARPATPIPVERERGYLWFSGTYQDDSTAFTTTTAAPDGTGAITTAYDGVQPIVADVAIGQLIWNGLGIQIAGTRAAQITDAAVSSGTISTRVTELHRQELALHVDASWSIPASPSRAQVVVFAGPSLFRVKQGLVTGLTATGSPTTVESTKQHIGANGGVEVSVRLYKALGVGALVRYSRADVPFSPTPGVDLTIKAGGVQAGGGLHFRF